MLEAITTRNDGMALIFIKKNIFTRFKIPRVIDSNKWHTFLQ